MNIINTINLFYRHIKYTLTGIDIRILGIYRILFGLVLFCDIISRFPIIHLFYSSKGILPTSYILSSPYKIMPFTLLPAFNQEWEIQIFMFIGLVSAFFFIIGYRTKLFQIIVSIVVLSLHNKVTTLENGGDMVVNNFIIWSLFLPLGISLSIDSIKNSLKNSSEENSETLNKFKSEKFNYYSLAYFACLMQISMIYFFNYNTKTGTTWKDLTSLHYFFELDTFLTPLGYWAKDFFSYEFKQYLTKMTLLIELCVPFVIFIPIFTKYIRTLCFIILFSFHLCIGLFMDIGSFSWIMIAANSLLLSSLDINIVKNILSKIHGKSLTLIYDSDCGFCHQIVRIIKRLDVFGKITIYGNDWENKIDDKYEDLRSKSILVFYNINPKSIYYYNIGFFHLLNKIPFCFIFSWIFLIPGISYFINGVYRIIANNRNAVSTYFGLNSCGISNTNINESKKKIVGVFPGIKFIKLLIINIIIVGLLFSNIHKSLVVNEPFKTDYNFRETKYGRKVLKYLRMKQNWKMFAPGVLKKDVILVIDVETIKGKRIDPFTGLDPLNINSVNFQNTDVNYGQFIRKFMNRSVKNKNSSSISQLEDWLKRPVKDINGIKYSKTKNFKIWKLTQYSSKPNNDPKIIKSELISEYSSSRKKMVNKKVESRKGLKKYIKNKN